MEIRLEMKNYNMTLIERLLKNKQKYVKDQGEKQVSALETLKLKELKPKETEPIQSSNYSDYFLKGLAEM